MCSCIVAAIIAWSYFYFSFGGSVRFLAWHHADASEQVLGAGWL